MMIGKFLLNNIFLKSLRDHLKSFSWWSLGLFLTVIMIMAIYPTMKDAQGMNDVLASMPKEMINLWVQNVEDADITSPEGFLNAELFTVMLPVIFIIFAINIGKGAVSGEESSGTLEMVLSNPVSRVTFLIQKIYSLLFLVILLGFVLCISGYFGMTVFDIELAQGNFIWACTSLVLLGLLFGSISLFLGSYFGRSVIAVSVSASIALLTYLINALIPLVEGIKWMQQGSPFYWYFGHDPLRNGIDFAHLSMFVVTIAVLFILAVYFFKDRDLRV